MLQRDSKQESNMERTNDKSIELTAKELDAVTGGKATTGPTHLPPRNPFPWPTGPKLPTY
jgi:hypothetical protein